MNNNYNHYNKNLRPFAVQHRNGSTQSEIRAWCELFRNKKMLGYPFLRQRPVGNYIADFMCKELKLIIEIDGPYHQFRYKEDLQRELNLNKLGFTVLRFTNEEIRTQINNVERAIVLWIEENKKHSLSRAPSPSPLR
ncbi:MAG: hypothetical protein JWP12_3069 [Bacteroidetes bacterium]|nr:hypothetical protein [Bacteroidota bacterium]